MTDYRINGFQHIGVAVQDMDASLKFYRKYFGLNIPFFDAVAAAPLMQTYTRGEVITKRASMILNLMGGCAMEVIRATSFEPTAAKFDLELGDLGIFVTQMKCPDVKAAHSFCVKESETSPSEITTRPDGTPTFFVQDLDGNYFQYVEGGDWYTKPNHISGGVSACTIGVSDIDKAMELYASILGYDDVKTDDTRVWDDFKSLPGGSRKFRRVILGQSNPPGGGFAKISAKTQIELVQDMDRDPKRIFDDRIWADLGFVHLGLDVRGMKPLGDALSKKGYGFRCDSNDALDMGTTKVHCTYIDDPDETWLEMIEVHKVPIMEKWGIFLDVAKRDPNKPLPDFMLKALKFSRIKD
ncbi:MAG: VOC family protein [Flavobacteriales bacterium]|nr:VOC family protein [Flavobacteriales bacterium]MDG1781239.1 VOC family protein [Flavobacteriales bacterium]MDG2245394.1 VOC family protein [Flavobacteriales bacterium]